MCVGTWLGLLANRSVACGQPLRKFLFRPLANNRKTFIEEPMRSACIGERVKKASSSIGKSKQYSSYSLRNGGMQGVIRKGKSVREKSRRGLISVKKYGINTSRGSEKDSRTITGEISGIRVKKNFNII
jgi:hypothetical protein